MGDTDPFFQTFLSFQAGATQKDNSSNLSRTCQQSFENPTRLYEKLDKTDRIKVLQRSFDNSFVGKPMDGHTSLKDQIRRDIEAAMESEDPNNVSLQKLFKNMAVNAQQRWTIEADAEVNKDIDQAMGLYLKAPFIMDKIHKIQQDGLSQDWERDLRHMDEN